MKVLVLYDSLYGNTKKIAEVIAEVSGGEVANFDDSNMAELGGFDLIFIGSPTQGGRPTKEFSEYISEIPKELIRRVKLAVFDTRLEKDKQNIGLKTLMGVIGFSADKMVRNFSHKGVNILGSEGFIVEGREGPLKKGEVERARDWAKAILNIAKK